MFSSPGLTNNTSDDGVRGAKYIVKGQTHPNDPYSTISVPQIVLLSRIHPSITLEVTSALEAVARAGYVGLESLVLPGQFLSVFVYMRTCSPYSCALCRKMPQTQLSENEHGRRTDGHKVIHNPNAYLPQYRAYGSSAVTNYVIRHDLGARRA